MDELKKKREEKQKEEEENGEGNFCYACQNCDRTDWKLLKSGEIECKFCQSILSADWRWR